MAISYVDVGAYRVWLAAYNPRDALSLLYADWAVARAARELASVPIAEVHQWLRRRFPESAPILDAAEGNQPIPRAGRVASVTPGMERFEVPIVAHLANWARKVGAQNGGNPIPDNHLRY